MRLTLSGVLTLLRRSWRQIQTLPPPGGGEALQAAKLLSSLWSAPLYACRLTLGPAPEIAVLDGKGQAQPQWIKPARSADDASLANLVLVLDGELVVEPVQFHEQTWGEIGLVLPVRSPQANKAVARDLLKIWAGYLGAWLSSRGGMDAGGRRAAAGPDPRLNKCNQLAELTGPVVHEFNNFLNTIVLQAAVLESQVAKKHLPDLAIIRKQAQAITGIIKRFQQRRDRERSAVEPRDLNLAVAEVVQSLAPATIRMELAGDLPRVLGSEPDLHCLITFLLNHALATLGGGDGVVVKTVAAGADVLIRVEDSGPALSEESLPQMFDATGAAREGADGLELAACKSIASRLQGRIRAENRPDGGLAVVVELPGVSRTT